MTDAPLTDGKVHGTATLNQAMYVLPRHDGGAVFVGRLVVGMAGLIMATHGLAGCRVLCGVVETAAGVLMAGPMLCCGGR